MSTIQDWLAAPISPRTLAVLRIVFSCLGLVLLFTALQDSQWLGGPTPGSPHVWMNWLSGRSQAEVRVFLGLGVVFGLTSLIGLVTPLSLLGFWLVLLNLRNHMAWAASEGGLQVVQCALLCLLWTPCGRLWSMDARFGWWRQSLWSGPIRVLQLLQIVIYLESGIYKLMGIDWWNGNALLKVAQNQNFSLLFARVADPHPLVAGLMMLTTWLVLVWELTFPFWLLWRPGRIMSFAIGIVMHATLWLFFDVALYPPAMLALYLTYLPDSQPLPRVAASGWKKGWVAFHAALVLWAACPVHPVYPQDPQLRSPVPGLAALESAAYRTRVWLVRAVPPVRAWQELGDNLGLNHRYNTFAPTTPNFCVLFRLRDQHGRLLWSDIPGEGKRYSWTVLAVRTLATCSPEALPLFFQRAAANFNSQEGLVLEEWLVELGRPYSSRVLNQSWSWLPLSSHEGQQGLGIGK